MWYLNDAPEAVSDTVRASVTIGARTFDLACWETGAVSANTNKQGETVRMVLPETDDDTNELLLTLESEQGNSTVYKLLYRK